MRYYLDTNTLIFILLDQKDELSRDVIAILDDYSNSFYVSSVALRELILLYKTGKIKKSKYKSFRGIFDAIDELNYEVISFTRQHVAAYAELSPAEKHKDPNDHMIIAQAISDKIPLISSDRLFENYRVQGLDFIYNKR
jgi:PIN domain nuclease of toxin-antitoxin system